MPTRPNLLIFNPDQWRADAVGHLGHPAAVTPHLDAACDPATGSFVSFANAFCQNPVCTPSRCSFMTGWYPHTRGHRTMHHMLHPERGEPNLLRDLKAAGYRVLWCGKNDLVPGQDGLADHADACPPPAGINAAGNHDPALRPLRGEPGGDNWHSHFLGLHPGPAPDAAGVVPPFQDADWAHVRRGVEELRAHAAAVDAGEDPPPLCLYLPIGFPHPPYVVEEPYFGAVDRAAVAERWPRTDAGGLTGPEPLLRARVRELQNLRGWDEARWTELRAVYLGMVARVDAQFGLLVATLRETGLLDDTAVFVFSDHGDFTGDFGLVEKTQNTFEDCLVRVPFLLKPPAGVPRRPGVNGALVELVDFAATAYALAGVEPGHDHFGRSLLPLVAGEAATHRDAVFCEGGRLEHEWHCAEQVGPEAEDFESFYWPRLQTQRDGVAHGKATMVRTRTHKYVRRDREADGLYDLVADPAERHNRIDDPALAGVLGELRLRMLTWYQRTCDVVPREPDERGIRS